MAVNFIRLKNNVRLAYPLWSMLQTFRLNSRSKGERRDGRVTSPSVLQNVEIADSMESFISEITKRSADRFNQLRVASLRRNQSQDEITDECDGQRELIEEIHNCLDTSDEDELENLISKWIRLGLTLPRSVMCEVLEFASRSGRHEMFHKTLAQLDADFLKANGNYFELLGLELDWKSGRNIDQLLERLENMHRQSCLGDEIKMRQDFRRLCSFIIKDCVAKKGESAVIRLRRTLEKLCEETDDYQLLFDLWRNLFDSFWFSDQQLANELIEEHPPLRKLLSKQLTFLCFTYLRHNNTEAVNRLIQIFLKFGMPRQTESAVKILFDFECWRRNIDSVTQIVQLCLKLDIQLTDKENKKFLDLLLKRDDDKRRPETKKIATHKYQFKF